MKVSNGLARWKIVEIVTDAERGRTRENAGRWQVKYVLSLAYTYLLKLIKNVSTSIDVEPRILNTKIMYIAIFYSMVLIVKILKIFREFFMW